MSGYLRLFIGGCIHGEMIVVPDGLSQIAIPVPCDQELIGSMVDGDEPFEPMEIDNYVEKTLTYPRENLPPRCVNVFVLATLNEKVALSLIRDLLRSELAR
jgi:hypothetical protein